MWGGRGIFSRVVCSIRETYFDQNLKVEPKTYFTFFKQKARVRTMNSSVEIID